jgi:hypothetical protein
MNTVTIERNRGEPEDYVYAPKDSKERDEKLSFYLETKKGWRVVTLEVVRPYRGFFVNDVGRELDTPFPDSPPKGISACQLLPPPCYESEDDAKKCLPENYPEWFPHIPEHKLEWGTIFQQIHEEALWVKPEHEKKGSLLRNGLAKLRWEARDKRRFEVEAKVKAYKKAYGVKPEAGHEQNTQDELRREADLQLEECKRHWKTIEALPWEDFKARMLAR